MRLTSKERQSPPSPRRVLPRRALAGDEPSLTVGLLPRPSLLG
jgi:hypothetical protein